MPTWLTRWWHQLSGRNPAPPVASVPPAPTVPERTLEEWLHDLQGDNSRSSEAVVALGKLGDARALGPLIAFFHRQNTGAGFRGCDGAIAAILERNASSAAEDDLRQIAALLSGTFDRFESYAYSDMEPGSRTAWEDVKITCDYKCVRSRDRARLELIRRGLSWWPNGEPPPDAPPHLRHPTVASWLKAERLTFPLFVHIQVNYIELLWHLLPGHVASLPESERQEYRAGTHPSQSPPSSSDRTEVAKQLQAELMRRGYTARVEAAREETMPLLWASIGRWPSEAEQTDWPWLFRGFLVSYY